jgi:hypothetical protein
VDAVDSYGIALIVAIAFVMSRVYCALLKDVVLRHDLLRQVMFAGSVGWLSLLAFDFVFLTLVGFGLVHVFIGPEFYTAQFILFVLSVPALANVLMLPRRGPIIARRLVVAMICTVFALFLVLLQGDATTTIFGID